MQGKQIKGLSEVAAYKLDEKRKFFSAEHEEILSGLTTDIYFVRTKQLLNQHSESGYACCCGDFCPEAGNIRRNTGGCQSSCRTGGKRLDLG